jgi:hypothetical protein
MAKRVLSGVAVAAGAGVLILAAGCCHMGGMHHGSGGASPAEPSGLTAKPVNTTCPIMGGKIDPALTRHFKGQTVAFCCGMCFGKWDKLNDQEKQAKLDKALGK